jgi:hypothetical protein
VSKIDLLLRDLDPSARGRARLVLPKEQMDDIMRHADRGVSAKKISTACDGRVTPFFATASSLRQAIARERKRRSKAASDGNA